MVMPSVEPWRCAARFHAAHAGQLLPWLPVLCTPILSDVLHSCLIRQTRRGESLRVGAALADSMRALPATLALKIVFEAQGLLWGLLPIVGIPRVIHHRICWGLASNVVVFEGRRGADGRARCDALANASDVHGVRALFLIPVLLVIAIIVMANVVVPWLQSRAVFWIGIAGVLWVVVPASAAVNTFFYLDLAAREEDGVQMPRTG